LKEVDSWSFTSKVEDRHNHFIILVYSCNSDEKNIRQDDEYTEYRWIPIPEIQNLDMKDGYKESIKQYLKRK